MKTPLALVLLLVLTSACGFRPVYGKAYQQERAVATAALSQVEVSTSKSRLGQLFQATLEDRLNPDALPTEKTYRLSVTLSEQNIPLFVAPDGTYGRGNIQYTAEYRLHRVKDDTQVAEGNLRRVSSYAASEINAIYASYVAQEDARKRGITELANDFAFLLANQLSDERFEITPEELEEERLREEERRMRDEGEE